MSAKENLSNSAQNSSSIVKKILFLIVIMFVFLVALQLMGSTFKGLKGDVQIYIEQHIQGNPIIGLFIGLFVTAIIQSSSTSTSLIVTAIAGIGASLNLKLEDSVTMAVPMIMGANIGTSITSTIVSLGHVTKKSEFRKAIASATVHDFFNIMVTCILLPMELMFGLLSNSAVFLLNLFHITGGASNEGGFSLMGMTIKPIAKYIYALLQKNFWFNLIASMGLLFISLRELSNILKSLIIGKSQERFEKVVFGSPIQSLLWGAGLTAAVQSSSVTTSLTVPLVATNKISLRRVFPFLLGANIGTTVTALIAAFSADLLTREMAVAIAFCHLLFNVFGVVIFMALPFLRDVPVKIARKLGQATMKQRWVGFAYIGITFFVIPILLIIFTQ
ncbi:MAG: Na/Pi cotransporter family protein [Cytophagales bacterium]|nr:Na/Pi cotransporter family protein [Cytophagales bacterium]